MAHFAKLNEINEVTQVHVLNNEVITDDDGVEQEQLGVEFLSNLHNGGTWKQTSYNNNFRKQYAGKGLTYDAAKDKFIQPQPFPSWSLDGNDDWRAPVAYPDDGEHYNWNEDINNWVETE